MAQEESQNVPPVQYIRLGNSGLKISVPIVRAYHLTSQNRILTLAWLAWCDVIWKSKLDGA
jgi:hypothetical protein